MSAIETWFMNFNLPLLAGDHYGFTYATNNGDFFTTPTDIEAESSFWSWAEDQQIAQITSGQYDSAVSTISTSGNQN